MWHEIQSAEEGCERQLIYMENKEKIVSWEIDHLLINNEPRNKIITFENYKIMFLF